ncbi:chromosomal replication initiation protein DnaA [Candidatus Epulonipiscioides gigas]|nr:chromosomal replication initiation protein DnaA [Epulopiscium sp. SCG-C07WGA-EpuloA2]
MTEKWEEILKLIGLEISSVSFNTWFKQTSVFNLSDDVLTLSVKDELSKSILSTRYFDLIKNITFNVLGKQYDLKFIIAEQDAQIQDPLNSPSNLNPRYIFDSFVVGNSNRMAHAAALAVAKSPAKSYNPLFLYGGVGLGKTHLMQSIAHYALKENSKIKILYTTTEKFTNELINSIRDDKSNAFRQKYRNIDILLIDDIQFIAGKERTQEEFFHTFNTLYEANKQIIISSDRPPKEIGSLEARLCSRFEWGLIADIQPPDLETRIAILRKKIDLENLQIDLEVLQFIAQTIVSNIRELEGALNRVTAFASLSHKKINLELAKEALKGIIEKEPSNTITPSYIQKIISAYYNITLIDLLSTKRTKAIAHPRQIAMYLCRKLTKLSLPKIGEQFGGRDHTTIIHGCDKILKELNEDPVLAKTIAKLELTIVKEVIHRH